MRTEICACAMLIAAQAGFAQTFEVASVKPTPERFATRRTLSIFGGPGSSDPTRIRFVNLTLHNLVESAYDVAYYRVSGPAWTQDLCYDVIATLPEGAGKADSRLMLQHLLAERFKLAIHREPKTMELYSLTIAKGGAKLQKPAPDKPETESADKTSGPQPLSRDEDGYPKLPARSGMAMMSGPGGDVARLRGHNEAISYLVQQLSGQLAAPVQDETGLTEKYDFTLSWVPHRPGTIPAVEETSPDLFSAVQRQLGLKLTTKKGPVEIIVIDSAEKSPVEN